MLRHFFWLVVLVSVLSCGGTTSDRSTNSTPTNTSGPIGPVTEMERLKIRALWEARDLEPTDVRIVLEEAHSGFTIYIIEHLIVDRLHYGAVIVPDSPNPEELPIFIMPDGLDQNRPVLDMDQFIIWNTPNDAHTMDFVQIYPAFRGRTLQYNGSRYFSPGDFCDAYDGVTDDTIAFLSAVLSLDIAGDESKILGIGISRGGNTVYQLAVRDPRISTVISMAGPVDFNRESVRSLYGSQYQCQFISGKTSEESRDRIIASSPIYFSPGEAVEKYFIFQGGADPVVPSWNSREMAEFLESQGNDVTYHLYPRANHGSFWDLAEHDQNYRAALDYFIDSLSQ